AALSAQQIDALLAAFAQTENDAQIIEFWNQVPRALEQPFLDAAQNVIAHADAQGQSENVAGLKQRLDALRKMLREAENTPPVIGALLEFLNAPDDAAARVVFENRRALLQPYEAQRTLDEKFQGDNEDGKKRIAERSALLRELRGGAPRDLTPSPSPTRRGEQDPSPRPSPTRRGEQDPSPRPSPTRRGEQDPSPRPSPTRRGEQDPSPRPSPTRRGEQDP